jgi:predicted homoserine dehydrogenase-like protein
MIALRKKSNMVPLDHLVSEVFAVAKKDLKPGDELDSIGGVCYYSLIDTYETSRKENLLPIGLAKGAVVKREIKMDEPITMDDVEVKHANVYKLWDLQNQWMSGAINDEEAVRLVDALDC